VRLGAIAGQTDGEDSVIVVSRISFIFIRYLSSSREPNCCSLLFLTARRARRAGCDCQDSKTSFDPDSFANSRVHNSVMKFRATFLGHRSFPLTMRTENFFTRSRTESEFINACQCIFMHCCGGSRGRKLLY